MTLCVGEAIELDDLGISRADPSMSSEYQGDRDNLESLLDRVEKETLVKALEQTRGNKTAAAKLLGISFGAFRYRLQKLGLG